MTLLDHTNAASDLANPPLTRFFTLRQILEKPHEQHIDTFHLFVDYKAAFDSPIRSEVFKAMSAFVIPAKLIRLCRITLSGTRSAVKVGKDLSEPFNTVCRVIFLTSYWKR